MNSKVLKVDDAARRLAEVVDDVHASGEPAVLVKNGRPVARIVAMPARAGGTDDLISFLRQWRLRHPEPDEQFAAVIDEFRKTVQPPHDPWEQSLTHQS